MAFDARQSAFDFSDSLDGIASFQEAVVKSSRQAAARKTRNKTAAADVRTIPTSTRRPRKPRRVADERQFSFGFSDVFEPSQKVLAFPQSAVVNEVGSQVAADDAEVVVKTAAEIASKVPLAAHCKGGVRIDLLTIEQEAALVTDYVENGNERSMTKLLRSFEPYLQKSVSAHFHAGAPQDYRDDLLQQAQIGFVEAVRRFDPSKGFRLSSFASLYVSSRLKEFNFQTSSPLTISNTRSQKSLFYRVAKAQRQMTSLGMSQPTDEMVQEIVDEMGGSTDTVSSMFYALSKGAFVVADTSGVNGEDKSVLDVNSDPEGLYAADNVLIESEVNRDRQRVVAKCLEMLNERERCVVMAYYFSDTKVNVRELAAQHDLLPGTVYRIAKRSLEKIRQAVIDQLEDGEINSLDNLFSE